jgi:hypothetical protein
MHGSTEKTDLTAPAEHDVSRYIECVFDLDDMVEVRSIRNRNEKPEVKQGWHKATSLLECVPRFVDFNADGWNIYVGANPRPRKGATGDDNIVIARTLFADFDKGCTIEEARRRWETAGLPEPTLIINSGHGVHPYWRFAEPLTDLRLWTQLQRQLIAAVGSDAAIHNPERVMRLPGFENLKSDPVPCYVLDADPARGYSVEELKRVLGQYAPAGQGNFRASASNQVNCTAECIIADGERNSTLTSLGGVMRRAGMGESELCEALDAINRRRCRPVLSDEEVRRIAQSVSRYAPAEKKAAKRVAVIVPSRPFTLAALPAVVGRFVRESATAIGCDPSFIALPTLACLARAIGNKRVIRLKQTWDEPAVLWLAIVGKSGTHKSPAVKAAMAILRRKQAEAIERHKQGMAEYLERRIEYEKELSHWKRNKTKDKPPWEPLEPVCQRFIVSDITIEALAALLDLQDDGVLLVRDELAGWINGIAEYKGGKGSDTGHWLASWSGEPFTVDRKTGPKKMIHVRRGAVSIVGGIQPEILRQAIGREHMQDGLCARLLLSMPDPKPVRWTDNVIAPATQQSMDDLIGRLLALSPAADADGQPEPYPLPLTADAKAVWVEYYNRHRAEQVELDDDLAAAWSKLEAYTARFALIFQLCRDPDADAVDQQSIESGIALSDWFGAEARRVYGRFAEDDDARRRRELIEFIRRKGGRVTVRDVMRGGPCLQTSEEAEAELDGLAKCGDGRWQFDNATGGRSRTVFELIQATDTDRSPENTGDFDPCVSVSDDGEVDAWLG